MSQFGQNASHMIRHASIYEARQRAPGDGWRVLVMRQWPRGIRKDCTDLWLKEAGPNRALIAEYNHAGLGWDELAGRDPVDLGPIRHQGLADNGTRVTDQVEVTVLWYVRTPP